MNELRATVYTPQPFGFRESLESEKLNDVFDQMRTTLLRTMLRAQLTRERVQELTLAQLYGNQLQIVQQESLRAEIDAVRSTGSTDTIHVSFYRPPDTNVPADVGIRRDLVYGQLSLAEAFHWSKVPVYQNSFGENVVADNVMIYKDGESLDHRHPLYWTLNQESDRFWLDNTATANQSTVLRITMPRGIRGEVNSVGIIPFPVGSCKITALEYLGNSGYATVPGFQPTEKPFRTHFVPSLFNDEIRVTLQANAAVTTGGETSYLFGLAAIDITLNNYETSGTAYARVQAPGTDTFTRITSLSADYFLDTNVPLSGYNESPIIIKLLTTSGEQVYSSETNQFPLTTSHAPITVTGSPTELLVRVDLREPIDGITPVVKGVTFTYE